VISSELIEVVGLCDRVCVMRDGEMVATLEANEISEDNIMSIAASEETPQINKVAELKLAGAIA